jgi:hypothetical protein
MSLFYFWTEGNELEEEMKAPRKGSKNHECQANVTDSSEPYLISARSKTEAIHCHSGLQERRASY